MCCCQMTRDEWILSCELGHAISSKLLSHCSNLSEMKANLNALKSVVQPLSHSHHITHELCTNVPEIYHISLIGTRGITGIKCSSPHAKEDSETRDEAFGTLAMASSATSMKAYRCKRMEGSYTHQMPSSSPRHHSNRYPLDTWSPPPNRRKH